MRWMLWWVVGCVWFGGAWAGEVSERAWQVSDSVQLRYLVYDPAAFNPIFHNEHLAPDAHRPALLSPDGRHFLFVSFRGDLPADQFVGELWVYSVKAVLNGLRRSVAAPVPPLHRVELRSSRGEDAGLSPIGQPRWRDARRIEFAGVQGEGRKQLYHLDIDSGELIQLTHAEQDIVMSPYPLRGAPRLSEAVFAAGDDRASVLYLTYEMVLKDSVFDTPLDTYPVAVIPQQTDRLSDPMWPIFHPYKVMSPVRRLYAVYRGGAPRLVREEGPKVLHEQGFAAHEGALSVRGQWLSPDGRHAVLAYALGEQNLPAHWANYERPAHTDIQYFLVDMQAGTMRAILDAPVGPAMSMAESRGLSSQFGWGAFWSGDSESVVLFNTALPLDEDSDVGRSMAYVVSYQVATGDWQVVTPMQSDGLRIEGARWAKQGETLVLDRARMSVTSTGPTTGEVSSRDDALVLSVSNGQWQVKPGAAAVVEAAPAWPQGLRVYIEEGSNLPQTMVAQLRDRRIALSEPDPALQGVRRLDWQSLRIPSGGKSVDARVLRPEGVSGRAPLAILVAGSRLYRGQFMPDGAPEPGYAAQALAAQGFTVLNLESATEQSYDENRGPQTDMSVVITPREGPAVAAAVEDAIDALVERGWVDPTRVGLIGFSRGGYHVYYTITHLQRHKIAAAVVFDSVGGGYGEYVNGMAIGDPIRVYELQYDERDPTAVEMPVSGRTFWENKQAWLDAPAFSLDRASTPTLFSVTGRHNVWGIMETLGAWRYMGLPFEYHVYPKALHVPLRPLERARAAESTVAWMRYWLQGEAPADAAQAQRWSQMKVRWEVRQARESELAQ